MYLIIFTIQTRRKPLNSCIWPQASQNLHAHSQLPTDNQKIAAETSRSQGMETKTYSGTKSAFYSHFLWESQLMHSWESFIVVLIQAPICQQEIKRSGRNWAACRPSRKKREITSTQKSELSNCTLNSSLTNMLAAMNHCQYVNIFAEWLFSLTLINSVSWSYTCFRQDKCTSFNSSIQPAKNLY